MATVSKQEVILPNGKRFLKVVKYNPQKNVYRDPAPYFSIGLPEEVTVLIEKKNVTGATQDIVERLFKEALQQYQDAAKKVENKIIVKLKAKTDVEDKHYQNGQDYELSFNWGVYEKTIIGEKYVYKFMEIGHPVLDTYYFSRIEEMKNRPEMKIFPWSKERQVWCENLEAGLLKMLSTILNFMNENDNFSFAARIDKGTVKLLN